MDSTDVTEKTERLKEVVSALISEAGQLGASAAEAGMSMEQGLSVTARLGEVETVERHQEQGLGLTVYFGQRKGSASTTDFSPDAIRETAEAACRIAKLASEDKFSGLPDASLLATGKLPDLNLYHPWDIDAEQAIELAIECEESARSYDAEISNSEGATVSQHQSIRVLGNSLGLLQGYPATRHSVSCSVIGQRGDSMQRDYWYSVARDALDLEVAVDIGRKAAERTVSRLGARSISTRNSPVLYSAEAAASLIRNFLGGISGGNLYRKSSFLLDSLGKQVFPDFIRIHEQPFLPKGLGSATFDGEGVALRARDIVNEGVVRSYLLSSYSARKLGMETTGNAGGVHNLTVEPGEQDLSDLLASMGSGLLVTELMGQGVNMVTGDYSRGASGFWVENGEIQFPVEEITIAGNLSDMLKNIVAIGKDIDLRGNIRTGSILVSEMTLAGE
ncbi:MAG TPA: metalloprotease PmbA [Phycisphaerae bacterium]|nr:metalloprotease PmbA [Phycisphaerae bacterium]